MSNRVMRVTHGFAKIEKTRWVKRKKQPEKTSKMNTSLSLKFRGISVPVSYNTAVMNDETAAMACQSRPVQEWLSRCEMAVGTQQLALHGVELQSVDMFGKRVGFVKLKVDCRLVKGNTELPAQLPGICFLRGHGVSVLVALYCEEEDGEDGRRAYAVLVEQPRVPMGQVVALELPAGMMDDGNVTGTAVQEIQEECGITIHAAELVDLTELALTQALATGHLPMAAIPPSPGGCDEFIRYLYLEKKVTRQELEDMQGRLHGLQDHGEYITVKVVPLDDAWKISGDAKVMISLFLLDQLRKEGKLPGPGMLATPLKAPAPLPETRIGNIPVTAFGLYKVHATAAGEQAILDALAAGYRHLDGAAFYHNEQTVGRAIRKSSVPRTHLFLVSKVWNDAVKGGRQAVRDSVERSLHDLGTTYLDLVYVHWPVPSYFVEAYRELQVLVSEGKILALGLSNFNQAEYEELMASDGITIQPVVVQMEVSPVMYRPALIKYFCDRGMAVAAYKPLNRAASLTHPVLVELAAKYKATAAQIMLKWGLQKGLIVICKTSTPSRLRENRSLHHFVIEPADMDRLDTLTDAEALRARESHEIMRKTSL